MEKIELHYERGAYLAVKGSVAITVLMQINDLANQFILNPDNEYGFEVPEHTGLLCDSWLSGKGGYSWYVCTKKWSESRRKELGYDPKVEEKCNHDDEMVTTEYICDKCGELIMAKLHGDYDTTKERDLDINL